MGGPAPTVGAAPATFQSFCNVRPTLKHQICRCFMTRGILNPKPARAAAKPCPGTLARMVLMLPEGCVYPSSPISWFKGKLGHVILVQQSGRGCSYGVRSSQHGRGLWHCVS
jgi:hypothetical protein